MNPITTPEWVLKVDGLGKVFGPFTDESIAKTGSDRGTSKDPTTGSIVAAWDVSFEVAAGEALGVVGESGSGKSTVMRCIAGDQSTSVGSVHLRTIDGGNTNILNMSASARRQLRIDQIAVVYQDPAEGLDLRVTAGGNIAAPLTAAGLRNFGAIRHRASELLSRTEVPLNRMDDLVRAFSGGMRQRLQIARNMVTKPCLVFMDEPTGGLDVSVQARLLDLIRGLVAQTGLSIVIVTHDLAVARLLSHRIAVMRQGRIVEIGLADQVLEDPQDPYTQLLVSSVLQV